MNTRRYIVRLMPGYRRGDKRWIVWDTQQQGWADDAHTTRRDAEDVRDELNAASATTASLPQQQTPLPLEADGPRGQDAS
jgi:hypothetical protein